jgi:type II secretory pathway component PulC
LAEDHLTDVVRSMPHYDGEQLTGLQVFPGQFASAFAQLGLRAGDIVTAINGSPIAEQAAATDMLRTAYQRLNNGRRL